MDASNVEQTTKVKNLGCSLTPTFDMIATSYISFVMAASYVLYSFCGGLREGGIIEDIYR